jgi:hypothetical protein
MGNIEILVPYDDRIPGMLALQEQFPNVRFIAVQGHCTYAQQRAFGVQNARGAVVALTEDHCIPERYWCARILEAHGNSHAAVGGVVEKQVPDTVLNWALYLSDYGRYMSPMTEGPAEHLTDCNVSYKRAALGAIADVWRNEFHEPIVHEALRAGDECLWLSPQVVVHQQRNLGLGAAITDRYHFGRLFGSGRIRQQNAIMSVDEGLWAVWLWRLIYIASTVFLPLLLIARVAGHVLRKRRCGAVFLRALPALVVLNTAWAAGEFVGYVTGRAGASLTPQAQPARARSPLRTPT